MENNPHNQPSSSRVPERDEPTSATEVPLPADDVEEEALDYEVIAGSMINSHENQQEKRKQSQSKYVVARHAKNLGVPPSSSGLGKSILDWTKSMLFMDSINTKLPAPPNAAEKEFIQNLTKNKIKAISTQVTTQVSSNDFSQNSTLRDLEMNIVKKSAFKSLSNARQTIPAFPSSSKIINANHDQTWVKHGHTLIEKSGITRPTYDWNDNVASDWNSAMTAIILHTWEICYQRGGASSYSIDESHNTQTNRLAIINRWISSRKAVWRKENPDAIQSPQRARSQSDIKSMAKKKHSKKEIRKDTAIRLKLMDQTPQISVLFLDNGFMSEPEGGNESQKSYVQLWRHKDVERLLHGLDEAYIQLGTTPRMKRERKVKIKSLQAAQPNPQIHQSPEIPPKVPSNFILESVLKDLAEVEKIALDLLPTMDLTKANEQLYRMIKKPSEMEIGT